MLAKVISGATVGLQSIPVEVEVDIASQGLPALVFQEKQLKKLKKELGRRLKIQEVNFPQEELQSILLLSIFPKKVLLMIYQLL